MPTHRTFLTQVGQAGGFSPAYVVMYVYLAGDPSKENKMDFAGFMAGNTKFPAQRTTE
jgi:hypothetical protein